MSTDEEAIVSRRRRTIDWRLCTGALWVSERGGWGFGAAWRAPMGGRLAQPAPLLWRCRRLARAHNGREALAPAQQWSGVPWRGTGVQLFGAMSATECGSMHDVTVVIEYFTHLYCGIWLWTK
ncbi:unnamed protein product [Chrysodeixis includens]|uniref:Uncharacterized protein n=1 Tax=Chrysodeixis includens TaxID=689277 RepID=A0A9N8PX13_CHRIL|nr:unnamed protein product [Chrysodeixis includens]